MMRAFKGIWKNSVGIPHFEAGRSLGPQSADATTSNVISGGDPYFGHRERRHAVFWGTSSHRMPMRQRFPLQCQFTPLAL